MTQHASNNLLIFIVYVNDFIIINNNLSHIEIAKLELASTFSSTNCGPLYYMLGIKYFNLQENSVQLYQRKFIDYILNKFNLVDIKPLPIVF
jgi:hypothetical protein